MNVMPPIAPQVDAIEAGQAEVWLYFDAHNDLIGFGSIGSETISLRDGSKQRICVIPFLGIAAKFQGKPDGPKEERYSRRIFEGLIEEVRRRGLFQHVFLYVDPRNPSFDKFYPAFSFAEFDRIIEEGREWIIMHRSLIG